MKKLQSNFTTPEQSRRLLELGVPADSADCYISYNTDKEDAEINKDYRTGIRQNEVETREDFVNRELPCWSVGRLMEILKMTLSVGDWYDVVDDVGMSFDLTEDLVMNFEEYQDDIDFSKLEE